jgi:hypothetical protein
LTKIAGSFLNDFLKTLSQVAFNKQIKIICKIAGINEVVRGLKKTGRPSHNI